MRRLLLLLGSAAALLTSLLLAGSAGAAGGWTVVPSPNVNTDVNHLAAVSALSAGDAWAVGWYRNAAGQYQTLTQHWNGTGWRVVASPNVGTSYNFLQGVAAVSASDVWAVGYSLGAGFVQQPLIEHWNGTRWSVVPSPNPGGGFSLSGVAASSATAAWAVGGGPKPLVERWNGAQWQVVATPSVGGASASLFGVTILSPTSAWAVGRVRQGYGGSNALAEHWNGTSWSVAATPAIDSTLNGVATVGGAVWAAGGQGRSTRTLVERLNGASWGVVPTPTPSTTASFNAIAAASATSLWAVGTQYNSAQTLIQHWNGSAWSTVASPSLGLVTLLSGVASAPDGTDFAVGGYYPAAGRQEQTLILRTSG
jgi:hypothetical protein